MSRSVAKRYRFLSVNTEYKRFANRRVRKQEDVPNGGAYKQVFCQYNICDEVRSRPIPDERDWANQMRRK